MTEMYRLLFGICLSTFILSSCEGNTDVEIYIQNESSDTLTIKMFNGTDSTVYDLLPLANSELYHHSMLGGRSNPGNISDYIDSLSIQRQNTTTSINLMSNSSWKIVSEHTRKVPSNYTHRFVRVMNSQDF